MPPTACQIIVGFLPKSILVLLDYFWLEKDYYKNAYGMKWLETVGVQAMLLAGCDEVVLPWDKRHSGGEPSNMDEMLEKRTDFSFVVSSVNPTFYGRVRGWSSPRKSWATRWM